MTPVDPCDRCGKADEDCRCIVVCKWNDCVEGFELIPYEVSIGNRTLALFAEAEDAELFADALAKREA